MGYDSIAINAPHCAGCDVARGFDPRINGRCHCRRRRSPLHTHTDGRTLARTHARLHATQACQPACPSAHMHGIKYLLAHTHARWLAGLHSLANTCPSAGPPARPPVRPPAHTHAHTHAKASRCMTSLRKLNAAVQCGPHGRYQQRLLTMLLNTKVEGALPTMAPR